MANPPIIDLLQGNIQTTDVTTTTCATWIVASKEPSSGAWDEATFLATWKVAGARSDGGGSDAAGYIRYAVFRNIAGTLTQIGSTQNAVDAEMEDETDWNATLVLAGAGGAIDGRVSGINGHTIQWSGILEVLIAVE